MPLLPDRLIAGPVELLRWREKFVDDLLAATVASYAELHEWMPWASTIPTKAALREVVDAGYASFEADQEWQYLFREVETGEVVGGGVLHKRVGPDGLEIGYWVRSDRTGCGYATAGAGALTDAAFRSLPKLQFLEITMDKANHASAQIPRKLGFRLDREVSRDIVTPGHTGRGLVWMLNRSTWESSRLI